MAPLHNNRTRMKTKRQQQRDRIKALLIAAMAGILALVLAVVLIVVGIVRNAQTTPETDTNTDITEQPPAPVVEISLPKDFIDRNTAADYITVYDITSDKVLYEKNADTRCYPASTTKILTCLVTLKYAQSSTVFTVGNEIRLIDPQSSRAYLQIGQRLDLQTMLEAIMLPSGNDAAYTAAANIGRIIAGDQNLDASAAIKRFCSEMNKMAAELGAKDSHFENPDGIHQANHYTTAHDLALIAKAALAQPTLKKVMSEDKVVRSFLSGESGISWSNTNLLLQQDSRFSLEGATGMKTGHTDEAGYSLIASAERNGVSLVAVVMHADSANGRFEDAHGLLTVCFDSMD